MITKKNMPVVLICCFSLVLLVETGWIVKSAIDLHKEINKFNQEIDNTTVGLKGEIDGSAKDLANNIGTMNKSIRDTYKRLDAFIDEMNRKTENK
jgi:hypothetical protein